MLTTQIITVTQNPPVRETRWIPTYLERLDVESALQEAGIEYDDNALQPSPKRNRWLIEVTNGSAKKIVRKMESIQGFWEPRGEMQELYDDTPLALVTFSWERPEYDPYFAADWFED